MLYLNLGFSSSDIDIRSNIFTGFDSKEELFQITAKRKYDDIDDDQEEEEKEEIEEDDDNEDKEEENISTSPPVKK